MEKMMNAEQHKLTHSAIGSWSGYVFQGMCAVYVVLHDILIEYQSKKNVDQIKGYLLYLDAYDDFSIHDENNQAISLHQCKLHKQPHGFEEAQKQLLETKKHWVEQNICVEDTVVYFHSNQSPNLKNGISPFEDFEGDISFDADMLGRKIRSLIAKIFEVQGIERPQNRVYNALISLIDIQVGTIHQRFLEEKERLRDIAIAKESAIPFKDIIHILVEDDLAKYPSQYFYKLLKYEFIYSIKEKIEELYESEEDWEGGKPEFVQALVDYIGNIPIAKFEHIVQRLLPVEGIYPSGKSERNVCNSSVAQEFIQLVARCRFKLSPELDWNEKCKRQTPIAVEQHSLAQACKLLYKNRGNLDCLREYDILITKDGNEFIPSIIDKASIISSIGTTNDDDKNIFKENKVGLLSLSKFNAGDYE